MLVTALLRGATSFVTSGVTLNALQKGVQRGRSLSTNTQHAVEGATPEAHQHVLKKITGYVEENTHKFGGWYYATSLTGGALSIVSGIIYTSYRAFNNRIDILDTALNNRIDTLDNRIDTLDRRVGNVEQQLSELRMDVNHLDKNMSELKADFREVRMYIMQQTTQQRAYSSSPRENTPKND